MASAKRRESREVDETKSTIDGASVLARALKEQVYLITAALLLVNEHKC
jgi:hypothetical protein